MFALADMEDFTSINLKVDPEMGIEFGKDTHPFRKAII